MHMKQLFYIERMLIDMKCVEYFYTEKEANDFKRVLENENFEEIEIIRTVDEDADAPCYVWEVSWNPKPL